MHLCLLLNMQITFLNYKMVYKKTKNITTQLKHVFFFLSMETLDHSTALNEVIQVYAVASIVNPMTSPLHFVCFSLLNM